MVSRRAAALLLLLLLVVAACTDEPDDGPSPSTSASDEAAALVDPGERLAIVVGPTGLVPAAEAAALEQAAADLRASVGGGVGEDPSLEPVAEVRVWRADTPTFARDLVGFAVADGYDVVCLVGTGTAALVRELSLAHREARLCTTDPAITGAGSNAVAVGVDPAVLVAAGGVAVGTAPAPVGLLVGDGIGDVETLEPTFVTALPTTPVQRAPSTASPSPSPTRPAASPPGSPSPAGASTPSPTTAPTPAAGSSPTAGGTPTASPSPAPLPSRVPPVPVVPAVPAVVSVAATGAAGALTAAEQLAAAAPSRALVLAPLGGDTVPRAVAAAGTELVVLADWSVDAEGQLPGNVRVALTVDWGAVLRAAVAAAREEAGSQVTLLDAASDVYGAAAGPATGADAAAAATVAFLEGRPAASPSGSPSPTTPAPPSASPSPSPASPSPSGATPTPGTPSPADEG